VKSSTTFSKKNKIKKKEGKLHCRNRSKKEDYIVGTDQRRKTTLLEQIKEGRLQCGLPSLICSNNVVFLL
jgi:hypothetical protein